MVSPMTTLPLSVFALGSTRELGARIAQHAGVALAPVEERDFEDGEHKIRPTPVCGVMMST